MQLASFHAVQIARVRSTLTISEQRLLRRLWIREWALERERLWASVERRMHISPAIQRDIDLWICEE